MSEPLIDPRRYRHGLPDHEFQRFVNTGGPIKAYCGYTASVERLRSATFQGFPLPPCPECTTAHDRIARKATAA